MKSIPHTSNNSTANMGFKWHHVSLRQSPKPLTLITRLTNFMCIFEYSWPIKTLLENLQGCLLREMASTSISMTLYKNSLLFFFRHTFPNDLISTILVQKWFLPIACMHIGQEKSSLLSSLFLR